MFLISWNVAGLGPTLQRIDNDFCKASKHESNNNPTNASRWHSSHSFSYFLRRHGSPDIVCLQEHKIPLQQLASRSEALGISSLEGYESFWSCCVDPARKGFNGVVTFAKKGTVIAAESSPLNDKDLDNQGRCVMTDHGDFVLFNVYIPYSNGMNESFQNKLRFLDALENAVRRQKNEKSKQVIIAGDLNIRSTQDDAHWSYRSLNIDLILTEIREKKIEFAGSCTLHDVPKWKIDIYENWSRITEILRSIEAVPVKTKNPTTGETFEKYRVTFKDGKRKVFIGSTEASAADALYQYNFRYPSLEDPENGNYVNLQTLVEIMGKVGGVEWDDKIVKQISQYRGPATEVPSLASSWLRRIIDEIDLVDSFRILYPNAKNRFTCWDQKTNRRIENLGTRIDYILVSKKFAPYLDAGQDGFLPSCNFPSTDFESEEAALHAATASGKYNGASFGGGGIASPDIRTLENQFGTRSTGIIYTPPSYSDHVATSVLFNEEWTEKYFCRNLIFDFKDSCTKKSQPHKAQQTISSFFTKASR